MSVQMGQVHKQVGVHKQQDHMDKGDGELVHKPPQVLPAHMQVEDVHKLPCQRHCSSWVGYKQAQHTLELHMAAPRGMAVLRRLLGSLGFPFVVKTEKK
jgi:hypothetical protein